MNGSASLLFALIVLMSVTVGVVFCITEVPRETGFDHPAFPEKTVQQAPNGAARHGSVVVVGACFGGLVTFFAVNCMVLGLNRRQHARNAKRIFGCIAGLQTAAFAIVVIVYWMTVDQSPQTYVAGFPVATALMLYLHGLLGPSLILFLYTTLFDQWILPKEVVDRFHTLVAARRAKRID